MGKEFQKSALPTLFYTANLYRDLWGFYREMGVQGFHIYRVSLGIKLPVIVTVILQKIHREC